MDTEITTTKQRATRAIGRRISVGTTLAVAVVLGGLAGSARAADLRDWTVRSGTVTLQMNVVTTAGLGVDLCSSCARDNLASPAPGTIVAPVADGSKLQVDVTQADPQLVTADLGTGSEIAAIGASRTLRIEEMRLVTPYSLDDRTLWITSARSPAEPGLIVRDYDFRLDVNNGEVVITSDTVTLSPAWAKKFGVGANEETSLAGVLIELKVVDANGRAPTLPTHELQPYPDDYGSVAGTSLGPDVTVWAISGTERYGCSGDYSIPGDPQSGYVCIPDPETGEYISAFAIGTISCNVGDENLVWFANTTQHPVIAQNMYRLKSNRFEQIGMSWVKHGFYATDSNYCGQCSDMDQSVPGTYLAVGCSDLYTAGLNGNRAYLGPRSQINAHLGTNQGAPLPSNPANRAERRLQVENSYLYPQSNADAEYFVEGQYIMPDDAAANNDNNNVTYKDISVIQLGPEEFAITDGGGFSVTEQPAIRAWAAADASVVEVNAQVPGEGLFVLAAKAIPLPDSFYRYEYAVYNMNSDRSGGSFIVPVGHDASVRNIGFHDVRYHSGEIYDGTDWPGTWENDTVHWDTIPYDVNPNANALRFSTLYNFWFETNAPPAETSVTLGLFKPGVPASVDVSILGPATEVIDCNKNGIPDSCDLSCEGLACNEYECGTGVDCDGNLVPDECDVDCNENGIPDTCDLSWEHGLDCHTCVGEVGTAEDCNENQVPDECDQDCNHNGIPDDCDTNTDADGDGVDDCVDLCPTTTPPGICDCEPQCCCPSGICFGGLPVEQCIALGNGCYPVCQVPKCRDGCLLGDSDGDGDVDLADAAAFERCFSGAGDFPGFAAPGADCLAHCDFDGDGDVDIHDYFIDTMEERYLFYDAFSGP